MKDKIREPNDDNDRVYPCAKCGTLRSKREGGTTFTVCDDCWDKASAASKHQEERTQTLEDLFDLRWKADMRAIKMWRKGHPERKLAMPDHADLVVWLLAKLEEKPILK